MSTSSTYLSIRGIRTTALNKRPPKSDDTSPSDKQRLLTAPFDETNLLPCWVSHFIRTSPTRLWRMSSFQVSDANLWPFHHLSFYIVVKNCSSFTSSRWRKILISCACERVDNKSAFKCLITSSVMARSLCITNLIIKPDSVRQML